MYSVVIHRAWEKKPANPVDLLPPHPWAFPAKDEAPAAPLTREEKNRIQTRERMARARAIKKATRVNPNACVASNSQADKDKTAKIIGRRNEARSQ